MGLAGVRSRLLSSASISALVNPASNASRITARIRFRSPSGFESGMSLTASLVDLSSVLVMVRFLRGNQVTLNVTSHDRSRSANLQTHQHTTSI